MSMQQALQWTKGCFICMYVNIYWHIYSHYGNRHVPEWNGYVQCDIELYMEMKRYEYGVLNYLPRKLIISSQIIHWN